MEKHVTSLELSKRLKALGVKQVSEWYWKSYADVNIKDTWELVNTKVMNIPCYSAFLASELGELLKKSNITHEQLEQAYLRVIEPSSYEPTEMLITCITDVDILALMLEYLIQNKLITI